MSKIPHLQSQIAIVSARTQVQIENNGQENVKLTERAQRANTICHQHHKNRWPRFKGKASHTYTKNNNGFEALHSIRGSNGRVKGS